MSPAGLLPAVRRLPGVAGPPVAVVIDGAAFRLWQERPGHRGGPEAVTIPRVAGEAGPEGWPGGGECARIAAVLRRRSFRGRDVVLSVPREACRSVEVAGGGAGGDAGPSAEAVRRAASAEGFDADACVLTHSPLAGGARSLVRGCGRAALEEACLGFRAAGLRVAGVRTRADAIAAAPPGAAPGAPPEQRAATAWLDASAEAPADGADAAPPRALLVVVEAGRPVYLRPVRSALPAPLDRPNPAATEALATELLPGIRHAEARCVADEAGRVGVLVAGGAGGEAGGALAASLAQRLGLREAAGGDGASLARGLVAPPAGHAQLLPPAERKRTRERRVCRGLLAAAAGYGALVTVLLSLFFSSGPGRADAAGPDAGPGRAAALAVAAEARAAAAGRALAATAARNEALQAAAASAALAADRPDWRVLLDRLAADAGERVRLQEIEVTPDEDDAGGGVSVRVAGASRDPRAAWDYALALEAGSLFERVDLSRTRRAGLGPDAEVLFQVHLRIRPAAPADRAPSEASP